MRKNGAEQSDPLTRLAQWSLPTLQLSVEPTEVIQSLAAFES